MYVFFYMHVEQINMHVEQINMHVEQINELN